MFSLPDLYGKDNLEALEVDVILETLNDIRQALMPMFRENDAAKKVGIHCNQVEVFIRLRIILCIVSFILITEIIVQCTHVCFPLGPTLNQAVVWGGLAKLNENENFHFNRAKNKQTKQNKFQWFQNVNRKQK